jgi:hypothetical protein
MRNYQVTETHNGNHRIKYDIRAGSHQEALQACLPNGMKVSDFNQVPYSGRFPYVEEFRYKHGQLVLTIKEQ